MSFPSLDSAVQGGFGYLQRPANLRDQVSFVVEIKGNSALFGGEGFWPAASSSSFSGSEEAQRLSAP